MGSYKKKPLDEWHIIKNVANLDRNTNTRDEDDDVGQLWAMDLISGLDFLVAYYGPIIPRIFLIGRAIGDVGDGNLFSREKYQGSDWILIKFFETMFRLSLNDRLRRRRRETDFGG